MNILSPDQQSDEMTPLMEELFKLSEQFFIAYGSFLPHGAFLNDAGQVNLVGAAPEQGMANATEVLPMIHAGLRSVTAKATTRAVGVSESVFIGHNRTPAIKVLLEHRVGLTMALYKPWKKRFLRAPFFGAMDGQIAEPEVGGWTDLANIRT